MFTPLPYVCLVYLQCAQSMSNDMSLNIKNEVLDNVSSFQTKFVSVNCVPNNQVLQTQENNLHWKSFCKFSKFTLSSVFTSQD